MHSALRRRPTARLSHSLARLEFDIEVNPRLERFLFVSRLGPCRSGPQADPTHALGAESHRASSYRGCEATAPTARETPWPGEPRRAARSFVSLAYTRSLLHSFRRP